MPETFKYLNSLSTEIPSDSKDSVKQNGNQKKSVCDLLTLAYCKNKNEVHQNHE